MKYDVIVAGAGVIGAMVARELARFQVSVCVLEKENDVACGASKANSGIIHGGFDPEPDTEKARLNVAGVPLLYEAAKELHVPFKQNGSFVCAFSKEEKAHLKVLYDRGIQNGVTDMQLLTGDEARTLEPHLSPAVTAVLRIPTAGIICPYFLTIAAVGNAMDNGAALKTNFEITAITKDSDGFTVTSKTGETVHGRYFVNCAGCYADKIAAMVDDAFYSIIPRAGEYMLLDKTEGSRVSHTIFQVPTAAGKGILVTPTADGNLLIGPTASPVQDPTHTETTPAGLQTVATLAKKSVPSVNLGGVITSFSGVRSSEKNGDFIIKESDTVDGFIHVAAIDSPGLSSSVAIAKKAVTLLENAGLSLVPDPQFNGERADTHAFRNMSTAEKDAYIKEHPAYGKIVCRCETVSEGEIRFAIRQNPRATDIDGVKRRTRAGFGRCQGGFCMPHVLRLLAEENGVEMTQITKKGKNSRPLTGKL